MRRQVWHPAAIFIVVLLCLPSARAADDRPAIQSALAALQRGDFAAAEKTLRAEVQARPNDPSALTLFGVALDNLGKFQEADAVHRRAIAGAPRSIDALNNYANHLVNAGDAGGARKQYLAVAALDPSHYNANVQLTRLALKRGSGPEALGYLKRLPSGQQEAPPIAALRMAALYLAGDAASADTLLARLSSAAESDPGLSFSAGIALADAGQFDKAENFLARGLASSPSDFRILFNLGVAASRAGHYERAREVLETALRQQPQNVDLLYNLAYVYQAMKQPEAALRLLAQAARIAPQRADVQKLLAITTSDLGALGDAADAWNRYLKLQPGDDVARRERGFTAAQMGQFEQGIADLEWFLARHPDDAAGHFELAMAHSKDDVARSLAHLDRALALQPDFVAARSARGSLYYQMGKPELALKDLEPAAALRPGDAANLDRLGQTYLALDRPADAVRVLRHAVELAPDDSKTILHFARALADAGDAPGSKAAMDRFRQLGPAVKKGVPSGLVDFLSLTPEQRHADYRARIEKSLREHPADAAAQLDYLKLLLEDGDRDKAVAVARRIAALKPGPAVLADAGRALLESKQYPSAKELLEEAAAAGAGTAGLDLAIATSHTVGPAAALQQLDGTPEAARSGDYYLARAQILEASGRLDDAVSALETAIRAAPSRTDLYREAAVFLTANGRTPEALRLLDEAARRMPQDREILLLGAVVLELGGRSEDAARRLSEIQNRWPEWRAVWEAHGIVLAIGRHFDEARQELETATALGSRTPETFYYLAQSALLSSQPRIDAAAAAIADAVKLAPDDPWIRALAGRIASHDSAGPSGEPPYLIRLLQPGR